MDTKQAAEHTIVQLEPPGKSSSSRRGDSALERRWQHESSVDVVLRDLSTDAQIGLTSSEAEIRLKKHGPNVLSQAYVKPWWLDLLSHFTDFFSLMLQLAAILCFIAYLYDRGDPMHLYLCIFLYAVVIATSLFCFVQQRQSDKTLREFQNFLPPKALVVRDGTTPALIDASDLVAGDIVVINAGDKIPADVRIVETHAFAVDNASLTGESIPITLTSNVNHGNPLDAANLAFFGCFAVEGSCKAVVIATGDGTVFGDIAKLTATADNDSEQVQTTLQRDIHHFVVSISIFAFIVGLIFFAIGLHLRTRLVQNVVYTIGIIVSNVPEGLMATVTVSLTASARRMARKNVLVKRMDAVETVGSTTVIVTDKTGTLTQNRMNVSHASFGGTVHTTTFDWVAPRDDEFDAFGEPISASERALSQTFKALLHGASVCSSAFFDREDMSLNPDKTIIQRVVRGDASEAGVLRFTERFHDTAGYRDRFQIVTLVPFSSRDKFMVTADRMHDADPDSNADEKARVVMKGAPERVLEACSHTLGVDGVRVLTPQDRQLIERQLGYFAQRGERVLAYAERKLPAADDIADLFNAEESSANRRFVEDTNLCFVGLLSMTDPPRDGVQDAVRRCKTAGIRVMMVTGDHAETALTVAQNVDIVTRKACVMGRDEMRPNRAVVVPGDQIDEMDETMWRQLLAKEEVIFARTSPKHKLEIVEHLQQIGEIVTVTGDGCNDAPALKRGNTGVAMGTSGSDVSREAAEIVLLDDNFASVVNAVEEGRLIFDNLKKSIAYTLTSNVPQLIPFTLFILLRIPLALTTLLILSIDLGTDVFPAIALAYERAERDIMHRPPRKADDRLLNPRLMSYSTLQLGVMQTIAGFFAYFVVFLDYGLAPSSLVGLSTGGHFATERTANQRWMYAEQKRVAGAAFSTGWFVQNDHAFEKYFKAELRGFDKQAMEQFDMLVTTPSGDGSRQKQESKGSHAQFNNMVKIISLEKRRPPCRAFSCQLDGAATRVANDVACFDPAFNTGPVRLDGGPEGTTNAAVSEGTDGWHGCFELWTPKREAKVLRLAQTAFFGAIVVAQVFTLFACKTRVVSVFTRVFDNLAIWLALLLEVAIALAVVYVPALNTSLRTSPLRWFYWLPAIPFALFIILYDEIRKAFVRRHIENGSNVLVQRDTPMDRLATWVHDFTKW